MVGTPSRRPGLNMNYIVVDASIILKIILEKDEKIHRKIKILKEKIITSPIFFLECTNTIRNKFTDSSQAEKALETLLNLPISVVELSKEDHRHILEIAIENQTTTYDSSYHHLALKYDCNFVTLDKNYVKLASELGHLDYWG